MIDPSAAFEGAIIDKHGNMEPPSEEERAKSFSDPAADEAEALYCETMSHGHEANLAILRELRLKARCAGAVSEDWSRAWKELDKLRRRIRDALAPKALDFLEKEEALEEAVLELRHALDSEGDYRDEDDKWDLISIGEFMGEVQGSVEELEKAMNEALDSGSVGPPEGRKARMMAAAKEALAVAKTEIVVFWRQSEHASWLCAEEFRLEAEMSRLRRVSGRGYPVPELARLEDHFEPLYDELKGVSEPKDLADLADMAVEAVEARIRRERED
jgi:hypothetical protein